MNNKTILGIAAIIAMTIIVVSGFYFFSSQTKMTEQVAPIQPKEAEVSTVVEPDEVSGIDEAGLLNAVIEKPMSKQPQPELQGFEFNKEISSTGLLDSMIPFTDLPDFEQQRIREYQKYVIAKIAKDTGKSENSIKLLKRGALETELGGHRMYIYQVKAGSDCEIHTVDLNLESNKYDILYNYCDS